MASMHIVIMAAIPPTTPPTTPPTDDDDGGGGGEGLIGFVVDFTAYLVRSSTLRCMQNQRFPYMLSTAGY